MADLKMQLSKVDEIKETFAAAKQEMEEKHERESLKYKQDVQMFKTKMKRFTQELSRSSSSASHSLMRRMAQETGVSETRNTGTQTSKQLITLNYLKTLDFSEQGVGIGSII